MLKAKVLVLVLVVVVVLPLLVGFLVGFGCCCCSWSWSWYSDSISGVGGAIVLSESVILGTKMKVSNLIVGERSELEILIIFFSIK